MGHAKVTITLAIYAHLFDDDRVGFLENEQVKALATLGATTVAEATADGLRTRFLCAVVRREQMLAVQGDSQRPYGAPPGPQPLRLCGGGLSRPILWVRRNAIVRGQEDVVVGRPHRVRLSLGECRELGGNLLGQST